LGLQSLQSEALTTTYKPSSTATYNPHNTWFKSPLEPEKDEVIRYTKFGRFGSGGQGEVHKVVDMYNSNYHACKIVAVKAVPEWRIYSEKDFRARVELEVNLVKQVQHHMSSLFWLSACLTLTASGQYRTIQIHTEIRDWREYRNLHAGL
jgi:serine/threonine protein kinase